MVMVPMNANAHHVIGQALPNNAITNTATNEIPNDALRNCLLRLRYL
jgi:hypothetical protein